MALVLKRAYDYYRYYFYEIKDERSEKYFLLENPPMAFTLILAGYLMMIKLGPALMKDRKAYDLKYILIAYNLLQVVLNTFFGLDALFFVLFKANFNFQCEPCDYSSTPRGFYLLKLTHYYFLLKVLDLFDTLFIILKKKDAHLSFLHCYHHFFMCIGGYIGARWVPGGHSTILGVINTLIHSIMYFYYLASALSPEMKKSLWWKKHITQAQLLQFAVLVVHYIRGLLAPNCGYPKIWMAVLLIQNIFMLFLFGDFYVKAYIKNNKKVKADN